MSLTTAMKTYKAACIQMNSGNDIDDNLQRADKLLAAAAADGAALAVLPEFFPLLSSDEKEKLAIAEDDNNGTCQNFLAQAAKQYSLYIVGGTVPISAPPTADGKQRVYAASPLYAPDGKRLARYDKMHLFRFHNEQHHYDETITICAGDAPVAVDTPLGCIGLSVCYDLRFPELYRQTQPMDVIAAPSAFTQPTGQAHWQLLLSVRAVENLAHVIGAAQAGEHPGGRRTFGNSMIISPWGEVLARAKTDTDEVIMADINAEEREQRRQQLPALANRRL